MIKLPAFFSDGMVISKKAKIWGFCTAGEKVNVEFLNKKYETTADTNGRFEVVVQSESFGGPYSMVVGDKSIQNVYVGRVWLCGGQSNMEGPIVRARTMWPNHIINDKRIRVFQVEKGLKFDAPATDTIGEWHTAEGEIMDSLYAVPYFFARQLLTDSNTPIGLINTPAGGTPMQGWLPEDIISEFSDYYKEVQKVKEDGYIEKATEEGNKRVEAWHKNLHESDKGIIENWQAPEYNDNNWQTRMILDPSGLPKHGAVWLRKTINLSKNPSGKATLTLGRAENSVKVYVNGKQVIGVDYMYPPCTCTLPDGLLKEGKNVIAIRLVGDSNNPKFVPGKNYSLTFDDENIDLSGQWKWNVGASTAQCGAGAWFYGLPCGVYNHMLAPVLGYSADGMIWYQGESNAGRPDNYKILFTKFVNHVRSYYGKDFPIIFNQLANFINPHVANIMDPHGSGWEHLREQQRKCLNIPNTAMSVSIDCGEWNDLHPMDKKTVGERLALHARRLVYGEDIVSDGPMVEKATFKNGLLTISFKYSAGLWANGHPLLDIIDETGDGHKVYAVVKDEELAVKLDKIKPKTIRFGWVDNPAVTLYNAYNLPASPFEIEV